MAVPSGRCKMQYSKVYNAIVPINPRKMSRGSLPPSLTGLLLLKLIMSTSKPIMFRQNTNCPALKLPFNALAAPPIIEKPNAASSMKNIPRYAGDIFTLKIQHRVKELQSNTEFSLCYSFSLFLCV